MAARVTTNFLFLQIFVTFCLCASPLDLKQEAIYRSLHDDTSSSFDELHFDVHKRDKRQLPSSSTLTPVNVTLGDSNDVMTMSETTATTPTTTTTTKPTTTTTSKPTTTTAAWTIRNDSHTYYTSRSVYGTPMSLNTYWKDVNAYTNVKKHDSLSENHRTASTVTLSFNFLFYGHYVKKITIATGGFLYMSDFLHQWLTATQYIAPLMANFDTTLGNDSDIYYVDTGESFIVWWQNLHLNDEQEVGTFTFQVQLEKSGHIHFVYKEIPKGAHLISTKDHPVKVGLSDAYYYDQKITANVKRRTIYEYHRLEVQKDTVRSSAVIIMSPLPTCVSISDCASCVTAQIGFSCQWCTSLTNMRCSDGLDRYRQEWVTSDCHKQPKLTLDGCLALSSTTTTTTTTSTTTTTTTTQKPPTTTIKDTTTNMKQISTTAAKSTSKNCANEVSNNANAKQNNTIACHLTDSSTATLNSNAVETSVPTARLKFKTSNSALLKTTVSEKVTSNLSPTYSSSELPIVSTTESFTTTNAKLHENSIIQSEITTQNLPFTTLAVKVPTSSFNVDQVSTILPEPSSKLPVKLFETTSKLPITSVFPSTETKLSVISRQSTIADTLTTKTTSKVATIKPTTSTPASTTASTPAPTTTSPATIFTPTVKTLKPTNRLLSFIVTIPGQINNPGQQQGKNNSCVKDNKPITGDQCPPSNAQRSTGMGDYNNDDEDYPSDTGVVFLQQPHGQGYSRKADTGTLVAVILVVLLIVILIGAVTGWFIYAYKNPNSDSGRWLIEHRPSQIRESLGKVAFWKKDGAGEKYGVSVGAESVA